MKNDGIALEAVFASRDENGDLEKDVRHRYFRTVESAALWVSDKAKSAELYHYAFSYRIID